VRNEREEIMKRQIGIVALLALATLLGAGTWERSCGTAPAQAGDTTAAEELYQVEIKLDTAFSYVALEMTGSYDQHEAAFTKLYEEAMNQGIYGGMPFGIYWNSPADTPVEQLKWDLGFAAPPGGAPKPPLTLKTWPYTTMASLKFRGIFGSEEMGDAYARVYQWIAENGYQPVGPMMELFLNTPSADENGAYYGSVQIIVPVEKLMPKAGEKGK
jgi:AraC family transcriptional regulator